MNSSTARTLIPLLFTTTALHAQEPRLINFQGSVAVGGVSFDGLGLFKFAIVDAAGATSYWSNDGTSTAGSEPAAAVAIRVNGGVYSVVLGDTTLPNMTAIPVSVMDNSELLVRVWFSDGTHGFQLHLPDQCLQMDCPPTPADAWQKRRVNGMAPGAGDGLASNSVWTGSEWISLLRTSSPFTIGWRYNPATNSVTAVNTTGAPSARSEFTTVWTGTDIIPWGGNASGDPTVNNPLNTGGRYNPATNSWTAVTTSGSPSKRSSHTAVWTGTEMIVWGGTGSQGFGYLNTGGRYNPATNSWSAVSTTGAPSGRAVHSAVWTGTEMIVWGGNGSPDGANLTGGRYNPVTNTWMPVITTDAPAARFLHTAVWTGSEMIVWGGTDRFRSFIDGGRYNPAANRWTPITTTGAPLSTWLPSAVWTGREMIVWGRTPLFNGRYDPTQNRWTPVTSLGLPANSDSSSSVVWTGREMLVWGGWSGSNYDDILSYTPNPGLFSITSAVIEGGNLVVSWPSLTGRNYTLWQSESLAAGPWTDTGLSALTGTGETLTFTFPVTTPGRRFFRVQAGP